MNEAPRIAVVHGSPLLREGIRDLLARQPGVRVVAAFGGAAEFARHLDEDVVLLYDLGTAQRDGAARLRQLQLERPHARILFFNVMDDDLAIVECVRAGGSGCVLQDASVDEIVEAIRCVAQGTPEHSPRVITSLFAYVRGLQQGEPAPSVEQLTPREREILALLAEGLSNKEIAERLILQPQTVKNYVHLVLQKLDLRNRLDVMRALRSRRQ